MNIKELGIKELLFIFLNVKGITNNGICSSGLDVPDKFVLQTIIKNSKKSTDFLQPTLDSNVIKKFKNALNNYYNFQDIKFFNKTDKTISMEFNNFNGTTIESFLNKIFNHIKFKMLTTSVKDFSKYFALGAFAFRGSFDLKMNYYTADLHKSRVSTKKELKCFINLLAFINFNNQLNLNFRELQDKGKLKDTQFRINLKYFNDNYLNDLININPYRYRQFLLNSKHLSFKKINSDKDRFMPRMLFYMNNIVGNNDLDDLDIKKLRDDLHLNDGFQNSGSSKIRKRSNRAKDFSMFSKPDRCSSCHNEYDKSIRTFKLKGSNYWYFEMHHVISYANGKSGLIETENPDNYVKLCPACHRALTPNRADKDYQLKIINNILKDDSDTLNYVLGIKQKIHSKDSPKELVYKHLK